MLCSIATAETIDYTGAWYLVSLEMEGVVLSPADMGMEMVITLNEDGTGMLTATAQEDTAATWTSDGETITITAEGEPLDFVPTDDGTILNAEMEGGNMTFGREAPGPGFVPASEIAATSIVEFNGTWNITTVNAYGMVVPYSAMAQGMVDADGTVLIQNGNITFFGGIAFGTLTDGKLIVPSYTEEEALGQTICLLEDGTLSLEFMGLIYYCEKAITME